MLVEARPIEASGGPIATQDAAQQDDDCAVKSTVAQCGIQADQSVVLLHGAGTGCDHWHAGETGAGDASVHKDMLMSFTKQNWRVTQCRCIWKSEQRSV